MKEVLIAIALTVLLSGCSIFKDVKVPEPRTIIVHKTEFVYPDIPQELLEKTTVPIWRPPEGRPPMQSDVSIYIGELYESLGICSAKLEQVHWLLVKSKSTSHDLHK